ncbi:MAG TPA: peptidoglycan DD-metalloendopeptidase family protein, partial [Polyangiaceae bacterium]
EASGFDDPSSKPRVQVTADDFAKLVKSVDRDEDSLRKRLDELNREAKVADARTLARGRAYVRLARVGLLPVGEGFDALADHAARLERLRHGIEADLALTKRLAAERVAIGKKLDEIDARRGTLDAERQVLEQAETALRSAEERDQAFQQAFESPGHTAVYGAGVGPSDPNALLAGFAAQKGSLAFPIAGRTTIRPAKRPSSDGPGLEFRAPPGSAVRCVFQGRVAFADSYPEYGKTVIIDHGRRYYTLSANLESIDVEVGDELGTGERLGTLGNEKAAVLYFEIRVNKATVDPSEWFGL